jgi:hypothetical protein
MNKTTQPTLKGEWKHVSDPIAKPVDEQTYLVTYLRMDNSYSLPHLAYWIDDEKHFFSLESIHAQPLYVDLYIEIPDYPC